MNYTLFNKRVLISIIYYRLDIVLYNYILLENLMENRVIEEIL